MVNLKFTWPHGAKEWQIVKEEHEKVEGRDNVLNSVLSLLLMGAFPTLH